MLSLTELLIFELSPVCNLGGAHWRCPNRHPGRWEKLSRAERLLDDTIVECAVSAYGDYGFTGWIGWHYYNEPTLQKERMLDLMLTIRSIEPRARFLLWTNGTSREWVEQPEIRRQFDRVVSSDYANDPHGEMLDDRLFRRLPMQGERPCPRAFVELILDCCGNHHPCCYDWRGEGSLGNVFDCGWPELVQRWQLFQRAVGLGQWTAIAEHSPRCAALRAALATCRQCGRRGNLLGWDAEIVARIRTARNQQ